MRYLNRYNKLRKVTSFSRRKFIGGAAGLGFAALTSSSSSLFAKSTRQKMAMNISGKIISSSDDNYEMWRKGLVWQAAKPNRKPELIVQAKSIDDVISTVNYARENKQKVIAKSGGHSICASFLRNEGILLNMLAMRDVEVDSESQTCTAQPGAWGPTVLNALEPHGLGFPVARGGSVSIGGFLMGGGLGFNPNTWRIACFSILGADVVLADGSQITVNEKSYPDIYWAVRGAGPGFFGIVTKYYLKAYPLPGVLLTSQYIHPLSEYEKVSSALETLVPDSDHKLEIILLLTSNSDKAAVEAGAPAQVCLINANAYGADEEESRALLKTIADSPLGKKPLAKKEYELTNLKVMTGETGESFPRGRMATEGVWSNSIAPVIATLYKRMKQAVTPITTVSIRFLGNTRLPDEAAFSLIGSTNILSVLTWQDEKDDEKIAGWMRGTMDALAPYSLGHYINNDDVVTYPERNQASFSEASWKKLRVLRKKYDPEGVFHDYYGIDS
ncbi:MAG: FAD-binding protein [Gammaproteobacteria bacterium]|nr:FAD-binding protein [Gammaproteobacteria bacterium]